MPEIEHQNLFHLEEDFKDLKNPLKGRERIERKLLPLEADIDLYLAPWREFSKENGDTYPDQGLLETQYDYLPFESRKELPQDIVLETLKRRFFMLELSNHPYRMQFLEKVQKEPFIPPQKVEAKIVEYAKSIGLSLSIGDVGATSTGSDKERQSRTQRHAEGPFIKLGRYARLPFTGSDSPDVWNTSSAISTMAASHALATISRNGIMADTQRQAALAKDTFRKLEELKNSLLEGRGDAERIHNIWKRNVGAILEPTTKPALLRAETLYKTGVRTFRVYSPEPGTEIIKTTKALRDYFGQEIEIFAGQVIDVAQAKKVREAGADGIFVGIGGGGRCITGVRSGSVIDWPMLVWDLRGEIDIPVVVEGGASDHVAETLLLGASGIGTSRIVAGGTIESPGGLLYYADANGRLFKPYGGEASARTKYLEGKLLPFDIPSFIEGEVTKAEISYVKHVSPTLTYNLYLLTEEAILAMIFRNVSSVSELQNLNPSPLRWSTGFDRLQRSTH